MNAVISLYLTATAMLQGTRDRLRSDEGQTSIEWLGIAFVVVSIIALLAAQSGTISELIGARFQSMINSVTGA